MAISWNNINWRDFVDLFLKNLLSVWRCQITSYSSSGPLNTVVRISWRSRAMLNTSFAAPSYLSKSEKQIILFSISCYLCHCVTWWIPQPLQFFTQLPSFGDGVVEFKGSKDSTNSVSNLNAMFGQMVSPELKSKVNRNNWLKSSSKGRNSSSFERKQK